MGRMSGPRRTVWVSKNFSTALKPVSRSSGVHLRMPDALVASGGPADAGEASARIVAIRGPWIFHMHLAITGLHAVCMTLRRKLAKVDGL